MLPSVIDIPAQRAESAIRRISWRLDALPSGARMTFAPGQVWVVLTTTNWATAGL
jgi:hypothetical protein